MQSSSASAGSTTHRQEEHLREQVELLKSSPESSSSTDPSVRDQRASYLSPPPTLASNGYEDLSAASQDARRAIANKTGPEAFLHPEFRPGQPHAPTANMMPIAPPSSHSPASSGGPPTTALAPAPAPSQQQMAEDPAMEGRKINKRELSQSKRAAQNRAAQRAFRQRKETYIKQLEQEVREYREMEKQYKTVQAENYVLREYVITLQSRCVDTGAEFPPPPPNVNLSQTQPPPPPEPQMNSHEGQSNNINTGTQLEAVAQAVAGLAAQEQMGDNRHSSYSSPHLKPQQPGTAQDTRSPDEINRHLQVQTQSGEEGSPEQSPAV